MIEEKDLTYIAICMKSGDSYWVSAKYYDFLCSELLHGGKIDDKFCSFAAPASEEEQPYHINISQIEAFYLTTPEDRVVNRAWNKALQDERIKETWGIDP